MVVVLVEKSRLQSSQAHQSAPALPPPIGIPSHTSAGSKLPPCLVAKVLTHKCGPLGQSHMSRLRRLHCAKSLYSSIGIDPRPGVQIEHCVTSLRWRTCKTKVATVGSCVSACVALGVSNMVTPCFAHTQPPGGCAGSCGAPTPPASGACFAGVCCCSPSRPTAFTCLG